MAVYSFDGNDLKMMLHGALELLEQSKEEIDSLNVFPVPDGDTGINMYMTLNSAVKEAELAVTDNIGIVAQAAAKGCILGARGNSGVILSQFFHGFATSLREKKIATASDITKALQEGAEQTYRAVMYPVEGTILTIVRKSAESAETASERSNNLLRLIVFTLKKAFSALNETPNQLPVLKEAGVVDAGGKGFVVILEGILQALKKASPRSKDISHNKQQQIHKKAAIEKFESYAALDEPVNFTYCTEVLIGSNYISSELLKKELNPYGDCLMVVGEETFSKVHIHTDHPGIILEQCLKYGVLNDIKINNMRNQQEEMKIKLSQQRGNNDSPIDKPAEPASKTNNVFAVVSVTMGSGFTRIMENLGADVVVFGGQTLNPSTGEILKAIEKAPSDQVIVLPNNKNIIEAAKQASLLSAKKIFVIPSRSIPQGLAALLTLNPANDIETTVEKMNSALNTVITGEITSAIRDTTYNSLSIHKGDLIALLENDLKVIGTDIEKVLDDLFFCMINKDVGLITVYYAEFVDENKIKQAVDTLSRKYPNHEFELQYGGQPVYDLIISFE